MTARWSVVYLKGDYDERNLPGVNDLESYDRREDAQRELEMVARETGVPEDHYAVVTSEATEWRLAEGGPRPIAMTVDEQWMSALLQRRALNVLTDDGALVIRVVLEDPA